MLADLTWFDPLLGCSSPNQLLILCLDAIQGKDVLVDFLIDPFDLPCSYAFVGRNLGQSSLLIARPSSEALLRLSRKGRA